MKSVLFGEQRAGEPAHRARDHEAHELITFGGEKPIACMRCSLERRPCTTRPKGAKLTMRPDQEDHPEQAGQAQIIELHAIREVDEACGNRCAYRRSGRHRRP